jgi:hypothetical protein
MIKVVLDGFCLTDMFPRNFSAGSHAGQKLNTPRIKCYDIEKIKELLHEAWEQDKIDRKVSAPINMLLLQN